MEYTRNIWNIQEIYRVYTMYIIHRIYKEYMEYIQGSQDGGEGSPSSDAEKPAVGPKEPIRSSANLITLLLTLIATTTRRKESITWSPFAALGKAASSGVGRFSTFLLNWAFLTWLLHLLNLHIGIEMLIVFSRFLWND